MKKIKLYLAEVRAPFFTGVIVPILLGGALAWRQTGEFSWGLFILTLVGGILIHAGANVSNDYFDHKSTNDDINKEFARPFTGGSRMIQNGLLTPKQVLIEALICYALGSAIGIYLVIVKGLPILWIGLFGAVTSFFYTAPPLKLVHRGIGEIFIGLNFGVLMVLGTYFVQTGELSWVPVIASLPVSLLIMLILYINEFQDYNADLAVGKLNWVARLGRKNGAIGYIVFIVAMYLTIALGIITGSLPVWSAATLITVPIAMKAIKGVQTNYDNVRALVPVNAATIQLHLIVGIILAVSCLI